MLMGNDFSQALFFFIPHPSPPFILLFCKMDCWGKKTTQKTNNPPPPPPPPPQKNKTKKNSMIVCKMVDDIKFNHKDFYRYTNSQRKDNHGIPPLKRRNDNGLAKSETEQAEELIVRLQIYSPKLRKVRSLYLSKHSLSKHTFE